MVTEAAEGEGVEEAVVEVEEVSFIIFLNL